MNEIIEIAKTAKKASVKIARLTTYDKNKILFNMAERLDSARDKILTANEIDVKNARDKGVKESMIDRLSLDYTKIDLMIESIRQLTGLKDYVGEIITEKRLDNGLEIIEKRVGFGVIGAIYESRPNVTVDVCAICIKSSSVAILKGGSDAINTNRVLVSIMQKACSVENAFNLIDTTEREAVNKMIQLRDYIDLIIPRGGYGLINFVRDNSKVSVIETGTGNCHTYVDCDADCAKAIKIIINAKTQRTGVCNALEKVIVHKDVADKLLERLSVELIAKGVEIRGCERTKKIIDCKDASVEDWRKEYLDLIVAIKIVDNLDDAISHINRYGTKHSEAIISDNCKNIERFMDEVDAAAVYSNASTRFTDGYEFGLGAEIGISTQKMHARGPMGLKAMTTTKYVIKGDGQVRE